MVMVPGLGRGIFVSQSSRQTWLSVNQLPTLIVDYIRGGSYQPELAVDPAEPDALTEMAGTYLQNVRVFSVSRPFSRWIRPHRYRRFRQMRCGSRSTARASSIAVSARNAICSSRPVARASASSARGDAWWRAANSFDFHGPVRSI